MPDTDDVTTADWIDHALNEIGDLIMLLKNDGHREGRNLAIGLKTTLLGLKEHCEHEADNGFSSGEARSCAQAEPTPGPYRRGVTSARNRVILTVHRDDGKAHGDLYSVRYPVEGKEPVANLQLAERAFTAAQQAEQMGYDPLSAIERLPQLTEAAEEGSHRKVQAVLAAMKDRA